MTSLLPQSDGYLPYFLIYTSLAAIIHSIVCYTSPPTTAMRAFSGPDVGPRTTLLAHVYAIKNMYAAAIRMLAAYNLDNEPLYYLAILSYAGVLMLYVPELLVWRTVRMKEMVIVFMNAGLGLGWMVVQRGWYLSS